MDRQEMVRAFNEWMRRYIEAPEQFAREWQVVSEFLAEKLAGKEPSYGELCAAYFEKLMGEIESRRTKLPRILTPTEGTEHEAQPTTGDEARHRRRLLENGWVRLGIWLRLVAP